METTLTSKINEVKGWGTVLVGEWQNQHWFVEGQVKQTSYTSFYHPWLTRPVRRYRHTHMSDAGYGSRVFVASGLVRALIAQRNIFGVYGPGKKK